MTEDTFIFVVAILVGTLTRYGARLARTTDQMAIVAFFAGLVVAGGIAWLIREPLGPTGRTVVAGAVIAVFLVLFVRLLLKPRRR